MKKILLLLSIFFGLLYYVTTVSADSGWEIQSFDSQIQINEDGSMVVTESIEANFFEDKHGIFRDIPVKYYDEYRQAKSIDLKVVSVTNELGISWKYNVSRSGDYVNIKIGDADVYLTGRQIYNITYKVSRGLGYFDQHDELYWDVTGNSWYVPISNVSATINLPKSSVSGIKAKCFTGYFGSTEENCLFDKNSSGVSFTANDFLTIVVGWPKGIVEEPSTFQKIGWFLKNNWGYFIPFFVFLFLLYLWKKHGDDPDDPPGLVTQFEPPDNLSPAEVGYLMYQKLKKSFLPAELVNLAHKGYIKIKEEKTKKYFQSDEYTLIKQKDFENDSKLKPHEALLLKGIFLTKSERKISDIPTSFYNKVAQIKEKVYTQLKSKKYFTSNPQSVMGAYMGVGIFVCFISFVLVFLNTIHLFVGVLLSGLIIMGFSFVMPKRTPEGVAALEYAKGFQQYIDHAETYRVKWEEQQNLFFQFLPYAMVFGIAEKWANAFEGIFKEAPEWFEGDVQGFNALNFMRSINSFSSSTSSSITPPQSSYSGSSSGFSGGGSSGGGGGGGGGGSW